MSIDPVDKITSLTLAHLLDPTLDSQIEDLRRALINVKLSKRDISDAFYRNELKTPTSNTALNTIQNFLTNNF
jgi:hypothetical protein